MIGSRTEQVGAPPQRVGALAATVAILGGCAASRGIDLIGAEPLPALARPPSPVAPRDDGPSLRGFDRRHWPVEALPAPGRQVEHLPTYSEVLAIELPGPEQPSAQEALRGPGAADAALAPVSWAHTCFLVVSWPVDLVFLHPPWRLVRSPWHEYERFPCAEPAGLWNWVAGEAASAGSPPEAPASAPAAAADSIDRDYAEILAECVTASGLVRYDVLARPDSRARLERACRRYAEADLPAERRARLALLCNAYNANALRLVLGHGAPLPASVKDIPGFFDRLPVRVAGRVMTLDELEREVIRPLGDPRVHAALVCAARSCPPLRREPFHADRLDEQLDDQCRAWVNDPERNRAGEGGLELSPILDWYAADFEVEPWGDRLGFLRAYSDPEGPIGKALTGGGRPQIRWLDYDWRLNRADEPASGGPQGGPSPPC